jgi:hypothetical protein
LEKRGNWSKRMFRCQIEKSNKNIIVCMHLVYLMRNVWLGCSRKGREWNPRYMHLAMAHCGALAKFCSYAKFSYVSDLALATLWMPSEYRAIHARVPDMHVSPSIQDPQNWKPDCVCWYRMSRSNGMIEI